VSHRFQNTQEITVLKGFSVKVWDNPHSVPVKNYTVMTHGDVIDNSLVNFEVFLGGHFQDASGNLVEPYSSEADSHSGGVSQGLATSIGLGGSDATTVIWSSSDLLPANSISMPSPVAQYGLPIVVKFDNLNVHSITFKVTFFGEELGTTV
jgi:hypothetical protein